MSFETFFHNVTNHPPHDYQCRLACGEQGEQSREAWLAHGTGCRSQLIDIPTGLGKTAAVVLAWLWNRLGTKPTPPDPAWPRRMVYCLPMRTLVEQTRDSIIQWISNLGNHATTLELSSSAQSELAWLSANSPVILMGGEELEEAQRTWDIHPERPCILIGTQDMLLSRALNRGYGMSRYRWPMHFSFLNNDCLWVMDETQLMGVAVETSAQLDGFRHDPGMPTFGSCPTWWMSATLDATRLATVDHPPPATGWPTLTLTDSEKSSGSAAALIRAGKTLSQAPLRLAPSSKSAYPKQLAELIAQRHKPGSLTLVVLNRVSRAQDVFRALTTGRKPLHDPERVALIHSRFRPVDRGCHMKLLTEEEDRIVVATQAVEAGVDVSARTLITELAAWSSLVQRIGRCNRRAEIPDAEVIWVDIEPDAKGDLALPYSRSDLQKSREALSSLDNASPESLRSVAVTEEKLIRPVIRRRDLVDLFDTTPDLCGQDLDISRYIRDNQDIDVQFFWREISGDAPIPDEPPPAPIELCRVSLHSAREFLKRESTRAWRWDPLRETWISPGTPPPGAVYLIDVASGGYDDQLGWTGNPKDKPSTHPPARELNETYSDSSNRFCLAWQTLTDHSLEVVTATEHLADALQVGQPTRDALLTAARWHDVGKAHPEFQAMLRDGDDSRASILWAKSENRTGRCRRKGFRHELASALAWVLNAPDNTPEPDLVAYLIAAHHGKVRLSIRSLPLEEGDPNRPDALFARGIWEGDTLPPIPDLLPHPTTIALSCMRMGDGPQGPSWLARMVALRDRFGPFRLAYLETLLRAADARASSMIPPVQQDS